MVEQQSKKLFKLYKKIREHVLMYNIKPTGFPVGFMLYTILFVFFNYKCGWKISSVCCAIRWFRLDFPVKVHYRG